MDGLEDAPSLDAIDYFEVRRIIPDNGATGVVLLHDVRSDAGGDVGKVRETVHAAIEISPDGFDLGDTEEERVYQTKDVESHLLCRERLDTVRRLKGTTVRTDPLLRLRWKMAW